MKESFILLRYNIYKLLWMLNAYLGPALSGKGLPNISVVIATFSNERGMNLEKQVRNVLKCKFVSELIVSNHNPDFTLQKWLSFKDKRLVAQSRTEKTSCAYRWHIAKQCKNKIVIVLDDDLLMFPGQLRTLCSSFLTDPTVPHGVSGIISGEYVRNCDRNVDYLYETYIVSQSQIERYFELEHFVEQCAGIEVGGSDFLIISKCGDDARKPIIHDIGPTLRCRTSLKHGVAVHLRPEFKDNNRVVKQMLDKGLAN